MAKETYTLLFMSLPCMNRTLMLKIMTQKKRER